MAKKSPAMNDAFESGPPPPKDPPRKAPAETRSLLELAAAHGHVARRAPDSDRYSAAHMCAAVMHGWNAHEHHYGPIALSDANYVAALEAAACGKAHAPANRRLTR